MAPRIKPFARIVSLLSMVLFVNCIRAVDLSHSVLQYNEAVENAQNQMLLLNIVRARMFRPMYLTDLIKVTGSIKLDFNSGGIEADLGRYTSDLVKGKGTVTSGKLTPSVDYAQNPTFEVNVLSTQEFMKGFTSPCTKDLLAYYWDQGWPPEFLLYLFVHHVEVTSADGKKTTYENYPDPAPSDPKTAPLKKLEDFGLWVTEFVKTRPKFVSQSVKIGPCLGPGEAGKFDSLIKATKEGISLTKDEKDCWQLGQPKVDLTLRSQPVDKPNSPAKPNSQEKPDNSEKTSALTAEYPADKKGATQTATLYLRSPEGMLFYLGELMRLEERFQKYPAICIGNKLWPLFVALGGNSEPKCKTAVVAVKYEGKEFIIPNREPENLDPTARDAVCNGLELRPAGVLGNSSSSPDPKTGSGPKFIEETDLNCWGGMSTESFSLLTQLIALQKSAKDSPTTSVIRAISQ